MKTFEVLWEFSLSLNDILQNTSLGCYVQVCKATLAIDLQPQARLRLSLWERFPELH